MENINPKQLNDVEWEIPVGTIPKMNVPGRVFASKQLIEKMKQDKTLTQCARVATLPGIYKYSVCLPDGHQGYGFPIGGVAALDFKEGGISPGGIGYDINCGVRLLKSNFKREDLIPKLEPLLAELFKNVPSGVGSKAKITIPDNKFSEILTHGAQWAVENGYGWEKDLKHLEENGRLNIADPQFISQHARKRGMPQVGSLGAGNHFLELQYVDEIYNEEAAKAYGLEKGQVTILIHTGSRGFGHQVCSDYLREMEKTYADLIKKLPERELVYAPAGSETADRYLKSMSCAANFAWANRQMIVHWTRQSFEKIFNRNAEDMGLDIVYDVAHNLAKVENHKIDGKLRKVYVHRKGATRAFGPGRPEIPSDYQSIGQPVFLPGSMGTASYVLSGSNTSMEKTFGSTAHGAGRAMSRSAARRQYKGEGVIKDLRGKGIIIKAASNKVAAEEAPLSYKDIDEVARVSDKAGIGHLVARLKPMGVVKG